MQPFGPAMQKTTKMLKKCGLLALQRKDCVVYKTILDSLLLDEEDLCRVHFFKR